MTNGLVQEVATQLDRETADIWLVCPDEIQRMSRGEVARGVGSHGQYFTTLVFAEAETRTLADGLLWGIIEVAATDDPDLATLKSLINRIVTQKAAFIDFVGMPQVGALMARYTEASQYAETVDELVELTTSAMRYISRVQMWIDTVFPWGVANAFKRVDV